MGGVGYTRVRDREFTLTGVSRDELVRRLEQVKELVTKVVSQLSDGDLAAVHPKLVPEKKTSRHELLVHLHGHLNFHHSSAYEPVRLSPRLREQPEFQEGSIL
jgi:hypothetical protein